MNVGEWVWSRDDTPPPRLAARIRATIAERESYPSDRATETLISASVAVLRDVIERPTAGRESALDLLAADALATYALEAAADSPEAMDALARDAMHRIATIAAE